MQRLVVVMGVAGTGKTTIGRRVAQALAVPFVEGDDFHDPASVEKMRRGVPLTDDDRAPWLDRLNRELRRRQDTGAVLACSALTARSRARLTDGLTDVRFVFLHGDEALLRRRLQERTDHYARADLLASQLDTLEEPDDAVAIDVALPRETIVSRAVAGLERPRR